MNASDDTQRLEQALGAIRGLRRQVGELQADRSGPVAVIGTACRFPSAVDPEAYWHLLSEAGDAVTPVPPDRWSVRADPAWQLGGFLDEIAGFDAAFFGINPDEALRLDPQQRLLLEVTWEAIERAAISPRSLGESRTGTFVGISESEYLGVLRRAGVEIEMYEVSGTTSSVAAGRIAYLLGLRGPALAVNTACSSALVAVHLAVQSLRRGECDLALAGGVSLMVSADASIAFHRGGALAADGRCKTFDAAADGYVRSEGCGVVVLKRLDDAIADGDPIAAVVHGSAINQDGRTNGLTAPSRAAQREVICAALSDAAVTASDVGYVEGHGTGTPLGDPIELAALDDVFGRRRTPLLVGSAKANVGHLEAAAGMAGLLKAIAVLEHRVVPPNPHFRTPTPHFDWEASSLVVPSGPDAVELTGDFVGVSSFGFSGTNAHLVVGGAPQTAAASASATPHALVLAAHTDGALVATTRRVAAAIDSDGPALGDLCATLARHRPPAAYRLGLVASTGAEAATQLRHYETGGSGSIVHGRARHDPRVAFLFAGQGSQFPGMGVGPVADHPEFRRVIERCDAVFREEGIDEPSVADVLVGARADEHTHLLDTARYAQPALYALQCGIVAMWRSAGVVPAVVLGHSTGELAAAHAAGVLALDDGARLVARRAWLVESVPAGVAVAALAGAERVDPLLGKLDGLVEVVARNGPRETVLAGPEASVTVAIDVLAAEGITCRRLQVAHAPHSRFVEPILDDVGSVAASIAHRALQVPFISNTTGAFADDLDASYWARQLRAPVRFSDCVATLAESGCHAVLDIGPQPVLQLLARQGWAGDRVRWLSTLSSSGDRRRELLRAAVGLYVTGVDVDWAALLPDDDTRRIVAPTSVFERVAVWPEPIEKEVPTVSLPAQASDAGASNAVEALVAELFGVEDEALDVHTTFIDLGADSLFLARLAQEVEDRFGRTVGVAELFDEVDTTDRLARLVGPIVVRPGGPATADPLPSAGRPADPLAGGTVERIVSEQLALMSRQLELLGASGSASIALVRRPTPPAMPRIVEARELTTAQRDHLDELFTAYSSRTAASRRRHVEHRSRRVHTRMRSARPETIEFEYPIVGERADGAHFWDIDGNEYVDLAMGVGVMLCGHWPSFVDEAVRAQMDRGIQLGPIAEVADEAAELLCEMVGAERAMFAVTGTDAVRAALRAAHTVTGRPRFAMFAGSYHGQDDRVLAVSDPLDPVQSFPSAPGISASAAGDALVLPWGSDAALKLIEANGADLAAVLVEPVQSRNPGVQPTEFLHALRALTRRLDIALVFDEVITGFRVHPAGAQGWYGIEADLIAYGKSLGGGFAVSAVAGAARFLDAIDGGAGGPSRWLSGGTTYIGSTYEMHPMAMAATAATLRHLLAEGPALQEGLNARTERLAQRLDAVFERAGVPIRVLRFSSMFRFAWKGNASYAFQPLEMELFHLHLVANGVYLWEGRTCFLSTAHDDADDDRVEAVVIAAVEAMRRGSFLPAPSDRVVDGEPSEEQRAALAADGREPADAPDWVVPDHLVVHGDLDVDALRAALTDVVERHEALRSAFPSGRLRIALAAVDVEFVHERGDESAVDGWISELVGRPFDVEVGPLVRAAVLSTGSETHHLALVVHHLVCDGISMGVIVDELAASYRARRQGTPADLPAPLRPGSADRPEEPATSPEPDRASWRERFPKGLGPGALPVDRPDVVATSEGARYSFTLSSELVARLREVTARYRSTLFMGLLAAHASLVHELTGEDGIVVGVPVSGRPTSNRAAAVGLFARVVPVAIDGLAAREPVDRLSTVRSALLGATLHQSESLWQLIAELEPDRDLGDLALPTIFNLDAGVDSPDLDGSPTEFAPTPGLYAQVDFRLDALEVGSEVRIDCDYRPGRIDAETVALWCRHFERQVSLLAAAPDVPVDASEIGG